MPAADPVAILSKLVSFRTDITEGDERPLAEHLAELLRAHAPDEVTVGDVPRANGAKAASWVYARFGTPKVLVNAHLDTVPPNTEWSADPFTPRLVDGKLYALGACDTKGAAAAILAALDDTTRAGTKPKDIGILFSGDEEFSSVVMRWFLKSKHREGIERAIVCEPTNLAVGARHRGFVAFEVTVEGPGGHSSRADTTFSPIAALSRLAVAFDEWARKHKTTGPEGFPGMCVNLAKLDGGVAFNVIPPHGRLLVSVRPPPGADTDAIGAELRALATGIVPEAAFTFLRENLPFATRDAASFVELVGDPARAPIDLGFWTEAALLSAAGIDAVVIGPGDIAQAHGPDEWVPIDELHAASAMFRRLFERRER